MTQPAPASAKRAITAVGFVAAATGLGVGFFLGRASAPGRAADPPAAGANAAAGSTTASAPASPTDAKPVSPGHASAALPTADPGSGRTSADARQALGELLFLEPNQALAQALAETHRGRRQFFVNTVLRSWSEKAPADALQWALARPAGEREAALSAVIAGAATRPEDAVFLVGQLCSAEPAFALERGSALITALTEHGHFADAAKFASSVDPAHRAAWTGAAFARWAEWDPKAASQAALQFPDAAQRDLALRSAITSWAPNEPASLAEFAVKLPAGETRTYALGEAMRQWIETDPVAASAWIDRLEPSAELDQAVAAIAQQPYLAERRPDVALSWAESITDRGVRASTLATLVQSWGQRDPAAARRYVEKNRDFSAEERKDLLSVLGR